MSSKAESNQLEINGPGQASSYWLGVDGGATKTLAIVVDAQGRECGGAVAGSSNYAAVGLEQAISNLRSAVEDAVQAAGCQLPLSGAWLGLAGIDSTHDYDTLFPHLQSLAAVVHLTNDAELLLSGLDRAVGVAVIGGTGSIALGRDARGTIRRAGGWGHILGDEGSGYEIGRQGLRAAVRASDGRGRPTALLDLILEHWQLNNASGIISEVYPDEDKAKIASLSTLVFRAARAGDEVAGEIVQQAANELALAAVTVSNALDFSDMPVPLALGGGLLIHEVNYREQVLHCIRQQHSIGQLAIVEQPALSAACAAISLTH